MPKNVSAFGVAGDNTSGTTFNFATGGSIAGNGNTNITSRGGDIAAGFVSSTSNVQKRSSGGGAKQDKYKRRGGGVNIATGGSVAGNGNTGINIGRGSGSKFHFARGVTINQSNNGSGRTIGVTTNIATDGSVAGDGNVFTQRKKNNKKGGGKRRRDSSSSSEENDDYDYSSSNSNSSNDTEFIVNGKRAKVLVVECKDGDTIKLSDYDGVVAVTVNNGNIRGGVRDVSTVTVKNGSISGGINNAINVTAGGKISGGVSAINVTNA